MFTIFAEIFVKMSFEQSACRKIFSTYLNYNIIIYYSGIVSTSDKVEI